MRETRQYSKEYKEEAVRLVAERGNIRATARELGISHWTLIGWVKKVRPQVNAERIASGQMTLDEENRLLKRQLASLQEDHEILKKAVAVFSQKPKRSIDL
jgi:transposase